MKTGFKQKMNDRARRMFIAIFNLKGACGAAGIMAFCLILPAFYVPCALAAGETAFHPRVSERSPEELARRDFMSVCPPFFLRDEVGQVIDPVHGINDKRPYSPKKTCGQCHDYELITRGYHFQQGKDERLSPELAAMYPWMRTPGQYGGRY